MPSRPNASVERFELLAKTDPAAARKLLERIRSTLLTPHSPGQREVIEATERFLILCAGRRWGKTKAGAAKVLKVARRQGMRIAWIAPIYKNVKYGYSEVLNQLPDGSLSRTPPTERAFDAGRAVTLYFKNASTITFYSAERPEGLLGQSFDFVVMDEAAAMHRDVWQQIVRPTLADRQGKALFISTPRGRNWFYRLWARGQDNEQPDYRSWRFPSHSNPTIPTEEWDQMQAELPEFTFNQEVLADFISNASSVFRGLDNSVATLVKPVGHVFVGVDLAKHHDFSVITAAREGDRKPCFHDRFREVSWPEQRRRILQTCVWLEANGATTVTVGLDATGIGDVIYDDLAMDGLDVIPVKFTNQWKQKAVMLLAADIERQEAWIVEDQRSEFESYGYKITDAGRWTFEAGTGHDDEVSAKLLEHWVLVNEGVPDATSLSMSGPNWASEAEQDDGLVEREPIGQPAHPRSPQELMNDPSVWR